MTLTRVGDKLRLYDNVDRIVGIYGTGKPIEESGAVITLKDAQAIAGKPRQVNTYGVKLKDLGGMERAWERIEPRLPGLAVSASANFADDQEKPAHLRGFVWAACLMAFFLRVGDDEHRADECRRADEGDRSFASLGLAKEGGSGHHPG